MIHWAPLLCWVLGLLAPPAAPPNSALAVHARTGWVEWWRSRHAPATWQGELPTLTEAIAWHAGAPGIQFGFLELAGSREAYRTRLVVVRVDPSRVRLRLVPGLDRAQVRPAWSVARASREAQLAMNVGQFSGIAPWGWLVVRGRELRQPGIGPLSAAVAIDSSGAVHWVEPEDIDRYRARGDIVEAFQSYPALLSHDGTVPAPLRVAGSGVELAHRDARLALGQLASGELLIVLTRFAALGEVADELPLGLTTPEMAAVMGALGCRRAVALDGGISAQLMVRDADGVAFRWDGLRKVPVGLEVFAAASSPDELR